MSTNNQQMQNTFNLSSSNYWTNSPQQAVYSLCQTDMASALDI